MSIIINSNLLERNRIIEADLLRSAEQYYEGGDLRWFFSYAHGKITEQINKNIKIFEKPNDLLRLNIHFAETYIRAVNGQPHNQWREAFQYCESLQNTGIFFGGEFCGARMAKVHIYIDLSIALREVGCISPKDYSNMLVFVNRSSLAALARLRGKAMGSAQSILQYFFSDWFNMNVEVWRNNVYEEVCHVPVPDVDANFSQKIHN